jgi:hypothetical protein
MPKHLPRLGVHLLAYGSLNLLRQVQKKHPPKCVFVVFIISMIASKELTFALSPRKIIERSDDQFLPAPLADGIDGAPMEAPSEPPAEPAARVVAKRAHLVRQLDPEELRDVSREVVIEEVLPAPASNQWVVSSGELSPGCVVTPVGGPSQKRRAGSRVVVGIHR